VIAPIDENVEEKLQEFLSPYLVELLQFLRQLIICRTFIPEDSEAVVNETRLTNLKSAEEGLRNILKKLQYQEEIAFLQQELAKIAAKEVDQDEEAIDNAR
jgi:hypothetical protein